MRLKNIKIDPTRTYGYYTVDHGLFYYNPISGELFVAHNEPEIPSFSLRAFPPNAGEDTTIEVYLSDSVNVLYRVTEIEFENETPGGGASGLGGPQQTGDPRIIEPHFPMREVIRGNKK